MKRWILAILSFIPATAFAAGAGGINLYQNPKAILNSTNTWTAAQTFSSITVNSCAGCGSNASGLITIYSNGSPVGNATTINVTNAITATCPSSTCTFTATAGSGGGAGGALNLIPPNFTVSTVTFFQGDFNVITDGVSGATITVKNSSGAWTASQTINSSITLTGANGELVIGSVKWTIHMSTSDAAINARLLKSDFNVLNATAGTGIAAALLTGATGGVLITNILTALSTQNAVANISLSSAAFYLHNASNDVILANINSATTTLALSTTLIVNQESADISNRTYFLTDISTGPSSTYRLLASSPSNQAETSRTSAVLLSGGMVVISSFVTTTLDPGIRKIPSGVWEFTEWAQAASLLSPAHLVTTISTVGVDGTGLWEIVSSTSTNFLDTNIDRFDTVGLQVNDIAMSTSDRIVCQVFGESTSGLGINLSLFYAGTTRFSHLSAPLAQINTLTQLTDHPKSLIGQARKVLTVNDEGVATVYTSSIADFASSVFSTFSVAMDKKLQDIPNVIRSSHIASNPTFVGGITAASGTITSSLNVMDVIVSSTGFIVPSGTATWFNITGGSIGLNNNFYNWPSTGMAAGQHVTIDHVANGHIYLIGGGDNSGGGVGGGSADNLGSGVSTVPVNATSGGITASSGVVLSSLNVMDVVTSSTGFIGNSSTMNYVFAGTSTLNTVNITSGIASGFTINNSTMGQVMVPLGLVGAPSLSVIGGRRSGIYFPNTSAFAVTFSGVQALGLSSTVEQITNASASQAPQPSYAFLSDGNAGMGYKASNKLNFFSGLTTQPQAGLESGGWVFGSLKSARASVHVTTLTVNTGSNAPSNQPMLAVDSDTLKFEVTGTSITMNEFLVSSASGSFWGGVTSTAGFLGGGSTFTEINVNASTLTFNNGGFRLVFSSAPDTTTGKQYLIWTQQANGSYLINSAAAPAGVASSGGGGNGSVFFYNGAINTSFSTFTLVFSSPGITTIASNGSEASTITISMTSNTPSGFHESIRYSTITTFAIWDTPTPRDYQWSGASLLAISTGNSPQIAPVVKTSGTINERLSAMYLNTSSSCRGSNLVIPSYAQVNGTPTLTAFWFSTTTATGNVVWDLRYSTGITDSNSWDTVMTTVTAPVSASYSNIANKPKMSVISWQPPGLASAAGLGTLSSMGWTPGSVVDFEVCRWKQANDTFVGAAFLDMFTISIPMR